MSSFVHFVYKLVFVRAVLYGARQALSNLTQLAEFRKGEYLYHIRYNIEGFNNFVQDLFK